MPEVCLLGHRGYTLIELVAGIVVAGILTTAGVVSFGPAVEHAKVRSATSVLAGDFQYAQVMALRERRPVSVLIESDGMRIVIRDRDQASTIYRVRSLGPESEFSLDALSSTGGSLVLFPNGMAGSTITVTLGLRGFTRRLKVTRAGQIRIIRTPS